MLLWQSAFFAVLAAPDIVQAGVPETALEGVYIENISVGGMNEEEITQAVNARVEELKNCTITLNAGSQSMQTTAGELGLSCANMDIVRQALYAGQRGNVLDRFKVQRYLEETGPEVLELQFTVDEAAVRSVIENQAGAMNTAAVDASLTLENGSFVVHEGQDGYVINADASVKKLVNYMTDEWHGGNGDVVLVTDVDEAQGDTEQLALVHDALGSSSTNYSSSNSNRKQNVKRGAELVNGTVLYPGEEFSMEEIVVPFTAGKRICAGGLLRDGKRGGDLRRGNLPGFDDPVSGGAPCGAGSHGALQPFDDCQLCEAFDGCSHCGRI